MACAADAARTNILARQPAISQDDLVTNSHPLDPLSADEIRQAAAILRRDRKIGDGWRFASIELKEPPKDALSRLETGGPPDAREAIVVCWDRADGQARRATVSLSGDNVTSWEDLPGQQPNMTVDEWHECDEMLRAHPALAEALARRGITDMSLVLTDMWAYGAALVPDRYKDKGSAGPTSGTGAASWATRTLTTSPACTRSST
jgi:primary-amine oxidase